MYNIPTSQYSEKVQCEKAPGISDSIERLYKECSVLQEQLSIFRDRVSPLLKQGETARPFDTPFDGPVGVSERNMAIHSITNKVREMQIFIECLGNDIDL